MQHTSEPAEMRAAALLLLRLRKAHTPRHITQGDCATTSPSDIRGQQCVMLTDSYRRGVRHKQQLFDRSAKAEMQMQMVRPRTHGGHAQVCVTTDAQAASALVKHMNAPQPDSPAWRALIANFRRVYDDATEIHHKLTERAHKADANMAKVSSTPQPRSRPLREPADSPLQVSDALARVLQQAGR